MIAQPVREGDAEHGAAGVAGRMPHPVQAMAPLSTSFPILTPDRRGAMRSGGAFTVRAVRPSDAAGLRDMVRRCSAEDVRLRCFGMSKTFADSFAARLARPLGHDEFAIAAVLGTGEIGGVVHAVALEGRGGEADYDIMVRTDLKGQGLGSRLMREMLSEAGVRGFTAVHGDVLMGNRAMLLLAGDLGFRRVAMDSGVVRIRATPEAAPTAV